MTEICDQLHVRQGFTSPMHAQSNGQVERVNSDIISYLKKYWNKEIAWEEQLPYIRMAHNAAVSATIRVPPFTAMFSNPPRLPASLLNAAKNPFYREDVECLAQLSARKRLLRNYIMFHQQDAQAKMKYQFDKRSNDRHYALGSIVYVTAHSDPSRPKKLQKRFVGPYVIIEQLPQHTYRIKNLETHKSQVVHQNRLKLKENEFTFISTPDQQRAPSIEIENQCIPVKEDEPAPLDDDDSAPVFHAPDNVNDEVEDDDSFVTPPNEANDGPEIDSSQSGADQAEDGGDVAVGHEGVGGPGDAPTGEATASGSNSEDKSAPPRAVVMASTKPPLPPKRGRSGATGGARANPAGGVRTRTQYKRDKESPKALQLPPRL